MASERVQRQIERLLDKAEEASAERNWEVVRGRARDVLTFDPNNADGLALSAATQSALGPSGSSPPDPRPWGPNTKPVGVLPSILEPNLTVRI